MKTITISLTTFLLSLAACLAYLNVNAQSTADQIKQLDRRRFDAQVAKDEKTLNDILADDLVYTHSTGGQDGKKSYIASITSGKSAYLSITTEHDTVRVYGTDLAIITGQVNIVDKTHDAANPNRLRYTDVYHRRNGKWQMVAWQSAKLPN